MFIWVCYLNPIMGSKKPSTTYLRDSNGFKGKNVFKRLLQDREEGAYIMKNNQGFEIVIPAHFFESAYRRVKQLSATKPLHSKYFSQSEINRLVSFIKLAQQENQDKNYGNGTIQLIIDVADSATKQRKYLLKRLNKISPKQARKLKKGLVDVALNSNKARVINMTFEEAIEDQKLKFSSRANRYPYVFSLINNNPNMVLINTVYMRGDIYPLNTLIVLGI